MRYPFIIFYHRVELKDLKKFETQIKFLKKIYNIYDINEVENLKSDSIIITFDDGYYDNFVFAYPILKKYNVKATIFITTGKITNNSPRRNLFDYWNGKISLKELSNTDDDYLSWEEIKIMHESGLINFQAHSHTHCSHFTSYYYVNYPQRKAKYLNVEWNNDKYYKIDSQFKGYQYLPHEHRFETLDERIKRLINEFEKPTKLIKKNLGYKPLHFCWPWGEYDEFSLKLGKKSGYKYFYTTERKLICSKINFDKIPRISSSFKLITFFKRTFIYPNKYFAKILRLC